MNSELQKRCICVGLIGGALVCTEMSAAMDTCEHQALSASACPIGIEPLNHDPGTILKGLHSLSPPMCWARARIRQATCKASVYRLLPGVVRSRSLMRMASMSQHRVSDCVKCDQSFSSFRGGIH